MQQISMFKHTKWQLGLPAYCLFHLKTCEGKLANSKGINAPVYFRLLSLGA